jgi:ABC-type lipoprotein release transport system permease subunit
MKTKKVFKIISIIIIIIGAVYGILCAIGYLIMYLAVDGFIKSLQSSLKDKRPEIVVPK